MFETEVSITLLELLKAAFYELTFYGTPEERDAAQAVTLAMANETRRLLDAHQGRWAQGANGEDE